MIHPAPGVMLLAADIAPAEAVSGERLLVNLLVILATAAAVAAIFRRLRLEAIPGYLVAGAIVGPTALGLVQASRGIEHISQLAIILLMFTTGLMLDVSALRRGAGPILAAGVISTAATVLVFWPVIMLFGPSAPTALVIAMALALSSTAVLIRVLQQRREIRQVHGRLCLGISIVQDLLSVVVLAVLPLLAQWQGVRIEGGAAPTLVENALRGAKAVGGMAVIVLVGRFVLPRVINLIAGAESRGGHGELILVASAATAIGAALATVAIGFSPEMGAFLAGFMLSFTPMRHQLVGQFASMRDLLMAIFFTAVGTKIDFAAVNADWLVVSIGVIGLVVGKTLVIAAVSWACGATAPVAAVSAVYLATAGEFTLVVIDSASDAGLVMKDQGASVIAVVVISLILVPLFMPMVHRVAGVVGRLRPAPWISRWLLHDADRDPHGTSADGQSVIIAGFGPVGRHVEQQLRGLGFQVTIIELNPATVRRQAGLGRNVVYGDVTNAEVLASAGLREADALIITIPDEDGVLRACRAARSMAPNIFIAVRTSYLSQAIKARAVGADEATVEEVATADHMASAVKLAMQERRRRRIDVDGAAPPGPEAPPITAEPRQTTA